MKSERQRVAGAKSSVSGTGIEAHGVSGGSDRVDLRCSMSISCEEAVAVWVVEGDDLLVSRFSFAFLVSRLHFLYIR